MRVDDFPLLQLKGVVAESQRNRPDVAFFPVVEGNRGNARVFVKVGNFNLFAVNFDVVCQNQAGRNVVIVYMRNLVEFGVVVDDEIAVADNQYRSGRIISHTDFVGFFDIEFSFCGIAVAGRLHKARFHGFNSVQIILNLFDVVGGLCRGVA